MLYQQLCAIIGRLYALIGRTFACELRLHSMSALCILAWSCCDHVDVARALQETWHNVVRSVHNLSSLQHSLQDHRLLLRFGHADDRLDWTSCSAKAMISLAKEEKLMLDPPLHPSRLHSPMFVSSSLHISAGWESVFDGMLALHRALLPSGNSKQRESRSLDATSGGAWDLQDLTMTLCSDIYHTRSSESCEKVGQVSPLFYLARRHTSSCILTRLHHASLLSLPLRQQRGSGHCTHPPSTGQHH